MTKKKIFITLGVVAVLLAGTSLWLISNDKSDEKTNRIPKKEKPLNVTMDFYNNWLDALQSTSTDPYKSDFINLPIVSSDVRAYIEQKNSEKKDGDLEPVLCQSIIPKRLDGKVIYANESNAQIMVLSGAEDERSSNQATVTLQSTDGVWQIIKIDCGQGESGQAREFDFEHSGYLQKQSVEPPLDSNSWQLIYEENGVAEQTVPLFFNTLSLCTSTGGSESICDTTGFNEGDKVFIQAGMSEDGAVVKKMRFE